MTADYTQTYNVAMGPQLYGKLAADDKEGWRRLNGSFENKALTQVEIASSLYDGHPITTQHKNNWRTADNYLMGQHLGIDFDTEDRRSTMSTLLKDPFIDKYGAMLYTTPSHTPDKPRSRAIFLLDTPIVQPMNYVLASSALLWIFGAGDKKCTDCVRFFFGGKPGACEMEWLGHELPISLIKDLIKRYQATGKQERQSIHKSYAPSGAKESEVVDALKHIDPWGIDYDEWVDILMAIHSEFPGANGEAIASSWGKGKDGEVESKWKSFKAGGSSMGRVGIGTMFKYAMEHGWTRS